MTAELAELASGTWHLAPAEPEATTIPRCR